MAKVIKAITQEVTTDRTILLVVTKCSPYGREGDIKEVNIEDAQNFINKGFLKIK